MRRSFSRPIFNDAQDTIEALALKLAAMLAMAFMVSRVLHHLEMNISDTIYLQFSEGCIILFTFDLIDKDLLELYRFFAGDGR